MVTLFFQPTYLQGYLTLTLPRYLLIKKKSYCECHERLTERSVLAHEIWWLRCWWTVIFYFLCLTALCFSVGVELAVSVSFIHFVCFIKQIAFYCVTDRYLFVCVHCRYSQKNSHNNENFYHHYTPSCHSKPVWLPFRAALFNENRRWFRVRSQTLNISVCVSQMKENNK